MLWLYNIATQFYGLIVRIFSLFNTKASLFINGRKNIFEIIQKQLNPADTHIWFHFASLGEFEQGRPVLEEIKSKYPEKKIVITFFSPSGYEIRKNYNLAAGVFYLPLDTVAHAKKLIAAIKPELAIFTKYEYWYHYFKTLHTQKVPLFIISGIFRPNQIFFKWYGAFNRNILKYVDHFFVQNEESIRLLKSIGIKNVSLSGDTRFDRVAENALSPKSFDKVKTFCGDAQVLIAGSTWLPDEKLLSGLIQENQDWKFIIAPHEIDQAHIDELQNLLPEAVRYSDLNNDTQSRILIINNIGLLASLYQYGNIAYIGGGFGVGIHNTLEAAAFGIPVIFGPKYDKFQEARDLISIGAAISVHNPSELAQAFHHLNGNQNSGDAAKEYVTAKTGSTDQIVQYLKPYFTRP